MKYFIGIDIGGTNLSTGVVDENYNIVGRGKIKTGKFTYTGPEITVE